MVNNKLKGALVAKQKTYEDCAKAIGISRRSFSSKINGITAFDIIEVNRIVEYLGLTRAEAIDIFLADNLHDTQETQN